RVSRWMPATHSERFDHEQRELLRSSLIADREAPLNASYPIWFTGHPNPQFNSPNNFYWPVLTQKREGGSATVLRVIFVPFADWVREYPDDRKPPFVRLPTAFRAYEHLPNDIAFIHAPSTPDDDLYSNLTGKMVGYYNCRVRELPRNGPSSLEN